MRHFETEAPLAVPRIRTEPRIDVIRDAKGLCGYGVRGLPKKDFPAPEVSIRLRPDSNGNVAIDYGAALQPVPRRVLGRSTEAQMARTYFRARWLVNKRRAPRPDEQRALSGRKAFAERLMNGVIRQALAEADPVALRAARRYPLTYRHGVYLHCAVLGARFAQVAETFPLVLSRLIYLGRYDHVDNTMGERVRAIQRDAREMILAGRKLREVADLLELPFAARYLPPTVAGNLSYETLRALPADVLHAAPRAPLAARRWARMITWTAQLRWDDTSRFIRWITSRWTDLYPLGANGIRHLADWVADKPMCEEMRRLLEFSDKEGIDLDKAFRECGLPYGRLEELRTFDGVKHFNPEMGVKAAIAASSEWHKRVTMMQIRESQPLPRPWVPGGWVDGYAIVPLTSTGELVEEGAAMAHCVATYAESALAGTSWLYSVRVDGARVATVDLRMRNERACTKPYIAQIAGPHNAEAPKDVTRAVHRWFAKQKALPASEPAPRKIAGKFDDLDGDIPF